MKKITLLALLATSLFSTINTYREYTECKAKEQAVFVLECIANANPKSDEGPEDWVGICKGMSYSLYCTSVTKGRYWDTRLFSPSINCRCSKCKDLEAKQACKALGL